MKLRSAWITKEDCQEREKERLEKGAERLTHREEERGYLENSLKNISNNIE